MEPCSTGPIGAGAGEALDPTKKADDKSPLKAALLGGAIGAGAGAIGKPSVKKSIGNTMNSAGDQIKKAGSALGSGK